MCLISTYFGANLASRRFIMTFKNKLFSSCSYETLSTLIRIFVEDICRVSKRYSALNFINDKARYLYFKPTIFSIPSQIIT